MKKRILSLVLTLTILCAFVPIIATAATSGGLDNSTIYGDVIKSDLSDKYLQTKKSYDNTNISRNNDEKSIFDDVPQSHWAYEIINELTNEGVIDGMGDGIFAPEGLVTRERFMKLLVCTLDCDIDNAASQGLSDADNGITLSGITDATADIRI